MEMNNLLSQVPALQTLLEFLKIREINILMRTCKILRDNVYLNTHKNLKIKKIQEKVLEKHCYHLPKFYYYRMLLINNKISPTTSMLLITSLITKDNYNYVLLHPQEYSEFSKILFKCGVYYGDVIEFSTGQFVFLRHKFEVPGDCYVNFGKNNEICYSLSIDIQDFIPNYFYNLPENPKYIFETRLIINQFKNKIYQQLQSNYDHSQKQTKLELELEYRTKITYNIKIDYKSVIGYINHCIEKYDSKTKTIYLV